MNFQFKKVRTSFGDKKKTDTAGVNQVTFQYCENIFHLLLFEKEKNLTTV